MERQVRPLSTRESAGRTQTPADEPVRDWSQLGRRVLAEAWRRTTDALASGEVFGHVPAAPAPFSDAGTLNAEDSA